MPAPKPTFQGSPVFRSSTGVPPQSMPISIKAFRVSALSSVAKLVAYFGTGLGSPACDLLESSVPRTFAIGIVCTCLALGGCCSTWWQDFPPEPVVCADQVVILVGSPPSPYIVVGTVSSPGGHNTVPADNYHRLQKQAACLGGVAVVLTDGVSPEEPDFWQFPHAGVAIAYPTSRLY